MTDQRDVYARLTTALGRSYRIERELGAGGMAPRIWCTISSPIAMSR